MDSFIYNKDTRSFSKLGFLDNFRKSSFQFKWKPKSKLSMIISPVVMNTCFKFTPLPSIYTFNISDEYKNRQLSLINSLKKLHKEVPVIRATKFENACYIHDFDKLLSDCQATDSDIEELCNEWGIDFNEFKSNIGPDIVILGDKYACAPILAHEFGHYMNQRGKATIEGKQVHELYSASMQWSILMNNLGLLIPLAGISISKLMKSVTVLGVSLTTGGICNYIGVAGVRPVIKAEWYASSTGLNELKSIGISGEEYKQFKELLLGAFDTYKNALIRVPLISGTIKTGIGIGTLLIKK